MDVRGIEVPCSDISFGNSDSATVKQEMYSGGSGELKEPEPDDSMENTEEMEHGERCLNDSVSPFCFDGIKMEKPDDYESEAFCASSDSFKECLRNRGGKCNVDHQRLEETVPAELSNPSSIDIKVEYEEDINCLKSDVEGYEDMPVNDGNNELDSISGGHSSDMEHSSSEFILGMEYQEYPILCVKEMTGGQLVVKSNNSDESYGSPGFSASSERGVEIICGIRAEENPFICSVCEASFGGDCALREHMRTHTGDKPFTCAVCRASFHDNGALKTHMLAHSGETPHPCGVCEKTFRRASTLKTHMLTHTGEKPHLCDVCEASFNYKSSLDIHIRSHTGEKPFVCSVCQRSFTKKGTLKRHLLTHAPDRPFACGGCAKSFREVRALKKHMVTHSGVKPFVCVVCAAPFARVDALKTHMRTHSGEKPHSCRWCERTFNEKWKLTSHMRTHTGEKPYVCDVCEKSFYDKRALKRHRRIHSREKPFVCAV